MRGCDSVIHLACCQGTQMFYVEPRQVLDVAVRGITNVLSACERTGVSELLLVSSSEVYQVPTMVPTNETVPLAPKPRTLWPAGTGARSSCSQAPYRRAHHHGVCRTRTRSRR